MKAQKYAGLSNQEAQEKLVSEGYNELTTEASKNVLKIFKEVMKEPMFILLVSCGLLYIILGDYTEGIVLTCWVFVIILITYYQYHKTERALESLKKLSSPRALVVREGIETRIAGREVVTRDIVILHEGDRVPADGLLLESMHISVDESLLTGESMPVLKAVENDHKLFSGTMVVQGGGIMQVTSTGMETAFGKIGKSIQQIQVDQTKLQVEMKVLIRYFFIIGIAMTLLVVVAFYFTRGNFLEALLNGLAASMAILPEEFPVVLTVFLAIGAWRLSQNRVLTRKPSAIETLGAATVLCSDKTGTITLNQMSIAAIYSQNTIIYSDQFMDAKDQIEPVIRVSYLATTADSADPMEKAIQVYHQTMNSTKIPDPILEREYPFSAKILAVTRVFKPSNAPFEVYCKGAPETILALCGKMDDENLLSTLQILADKGLRVLGLAEAHHSSDVLPESIHEFTFKFIGFIGFEDPIRPEVPKALQECYEAGIKVIMITGDYPATAKSIAKQAGLKSGFDLLTGQELNLITDEELKQKISSVNIFARIVPEQKLRIIRALQFNGEVVAMTGDGVNDAPALKAADIGVAMGKKGTDVAREASSLVLLDDNFSSIVSAIRSGRRIYDNLQKAMAYIIAIHIPIIGLTLLPSFLPFLPILLMPLHIVFMELIIDPVCSVAFESESEEKGIMNRPPRNPNKRFFGSKSIIQSALAGLLLLAVVLGVYFLSIHEGHTTSEIRAIAFSTLIIGNVFLILTTLSKTRSFISVIFERNISLIFILTFAIGLLLLLLFVPRLNGLFNFENPGYFHFIPSISGAIILLLIMEGVKFMKQRKVYRVRTD
jgi:Ca2+-transporting ATPase